MCRHPKPLYLRGDKSILYIDDAELSEIGNYEVNDMCTECGFVDPYPCISKHNGPKPGCEVRFLPKRVKFDPPQGYAGKVTSSAFPCALLIFDRRGI